MNAQLMAHKGFYEPDGRGEYAGCPLKYSNYGGLHFISYSTTIARVVNDRNGNPVTLVSDFNYSMTTSKHLSCISYASPHPVIYVPHCEEMPFEVFKDRLEGWQSVKTEDVWGHSPEDFLQAENRRKLLHLLQMFDNYQERVGGLDELLPMRNMGMVANWERLCLAIENKTMSRKEAIEQAREGFVVAQDEQRKIEAERDGSRAIAGRAHRGDADVQLSGSQCLGHRLLRACPPLGSLLLRGTTQERQHEHPRTKTFGKCFQATSKN